MSTGAIVAIIVGVAIVAGALLLLLPRLRQMRDEREVQGRREALAGRHREHAEGQRLRAEAAEQQARRERAEAELHESRAALHDRGLADDELEPNGDMPPPRDARGQQAGSRREGAG